MSDAHQTGSTEAPAELRCYRHQDRETLLSCGNCERPICTSCTTQAAVGLRCPECAGGRTSAARRIVPALGAGRGTIVATIALIVLNAIVFVGEMAQGVTLRGVGDSSIIEQGGVVGGAVADGEWWRLLTAGFIHASLFHIGFNMFALWFLGAALERYAGTGRMLAIYLASVLWGSAGALILSPDSLTVGASGGVFGLMAALLVLERQQGVALLGSSIGMLLLLNLAITFAIPGISIGGHLGGLAGGAAVALVLSGLGRGHLAYGKVKPVTLAGVAGVIVGAVVLSLLVV